MIKIRDDRQMCTLTGVAQAQFEILLETFTTCYKQKQEQAYQEGLTKGKRKRRPGGGRKGALPTMRDKLLFLLYYFKVYPTFDVLGTQFNMGRSKANENLYKLVPILYESLVNLEVMPNGIDTLLIDVTERNYRRSQDNQTQREYYSGKKTTHHQKYSLIADK